MTTTYQVRFWGITHRKQKARPYGVRWVTDGREHSEWFTTKALANNRRSQLMQAARAGEAFDPVSGLPASEMRRKNAATLVELAQEYAAMKWPEQAANSRRSTVEALATACAAFVADGPGRPEVATLRRVLTVHMLPPADRRDDLNERERAAVEWLAKASRSVGELTETSVARGLLDGLTRNLDGADVGGHGDRAQARGRPQPPVVCGRAWNARRQPGDATAMEAPQARRTG